MSSVEIKTNASVDEQVEAILAESRNHIFCPCSDTIAFCGTHLSNEFGDILEMPDGDECPDCYLVWIGCYCPYCGAHWAESDYNL